MIIKEIKTNYKPFEIFLKFKDEDYVVFLDSSDKYERLGKYSIIAFNPFLKFESKNGEVIIDSYTRKGDPFEILREVLIENKKKYESNLPFIGGAIGHFSYDLCHHLEKLPRSAKDDVNIPDMNLGFYNGAIIFEHKTKKVFITDSEIDNEGQKRVNRISEKINERLSFEFKSKRFNEKPEISSNMSKDEYLLSIDRIKEYIKNGDIYQVNMTQRFETKLRDDTVELYDKLRTINPAPFSAYLDFDKYQILSSSPERFIQLRGNRLETRPIKGTRPRGRNEKEDLRLRNELKVSEKDQAELLMIVDLERNDFSKVSKTSTVKVPELFAIEEYPTVFHLVSTVTCEMDDKYSTADALKACFPGGSITGAPKIRAMEIIDELEPTQRNIYTGSIGYIDFNGDMDLNIVIRTMVIKDEKVHFQVGGGIVWDSDAKGEYQESLDKAKAIVEALSL